MPEQQAEINRRNFEKYVKNSLSPDPPVDCKYKVGDKVIFTNDYGISFEDMEVIGFRVHDDMKGRFIHLGDEGSAYWYPHGPGELSFKVTSDDLHDFAKKIESEKDSRDKGRFAFPQLVPDRRPYRVLDVTIPKNEIKYKAAFDRVEKEWGVVKVEEKLNVDGDPVDRKESKVFAAQDMGEFTELAHQVVMNHISDWNEFMETMVERGVITESPEIEI
jgi:hypothetical protein